MPGEVTYFVKKKTNSNCYWPLYVKTKKREQFLSRDIEQGGFFVTDTLGNAIFCIYYL